MKKLKINKRKIVLYVAVILGLALFAFQALIDTSVFRSLIQVRPDYDTVLATLISDAARQLNKPAPVDPTTGKIYIPEARLVLPSYTGLGQIEYQYESGQNTSNNAAEVHLTSSLILNLSESKLWVDIANSNNRTAWQSYNESNIFNSIPSLQACTRGVQLFYSKQNLGGDFIFQGDHKLNDGRTLYVYSESDCKQDQSAVINLAKQAQSY
jgi:hypothetical protein